jgi:fluoride exporter
MRRVTRGRDDPPGRLQWSGRLPLDPDVDATVFDRAHHARVVALVFAGGCLGGVLRYVVARHWSHSAVEFPWATFVVNVMGALFLGVVVELATEVLDGSRYLRPLMGVGFCGALTTFSTIVVEVDRLAAHGHAGVAAGYLATTVAAGLSAGALGLFATRAVTR